ncbi:UDP-2,3-diacylglucosamine diphosphatase [Methylolobus aquaticus]
MKAEVTCRCASRLVPVSAAEADGMQRETLFISDLHLAAVRPETVRAFLSFLERRAPRAEALFILGDLFDAYIGDDDDRFPNGVVRRALRALADRGTRVHFQHGNRDFLLGPRFGAAAGIELLGDYAVIDLYGTPTLLTHGDLLCTDDVRYQAARQRVRTEEWKANALGKPLFARRLYARWYRFRSSRHKGATTAEIMDVNPGTVVQTLHKFGVERLIHGHTHRPAVHETMLGERIAQRIVLAEWITGQPVLAWGPDGYHFEAVDAAP